jgi:hypothetical protein
MNEEKLVNQIEQLKEIRPESDWVSSNKKELLGEERNLDWSLFFKPALAGASVFAVIVAFNLSQEALPGEMLFTLRKIAEQKDIVFSSEEERSSRNFELAQQRLEDLYLIASRNDIEKISPALEEFQIKIEDVNNDLSKMLATNQEVEEGLIEQADQLEERKEIVSQTLGAKVLEDSQESNEYEILVARAKIRNAENKIEQLRLVILSEEDIQKLDEMKEDLGKAKEYLNNDNCSPAFKIIDEVWTEISNISKEKQIR